MNAWLDTPVYWELKISLSYFSGCPVDGQPAPNITWLHDGQPISMPHHVLAAGQILQILNISNDYQGEISCMAQNEAGLLIQKTSLVIQGKYDYDFTFGMDFKAWHGAVNRSIATMWIGVAPLPKAPAPLPKLPLP